MVDNLLPDHVEGGVRWGDMGYLSTHFHKLKLMAYEEIADELS